MSQTIVIQFLLFQLSVAQLHTDPRCFREFRPVLRELEILGVSAKLEYQSQAILRIIFIMLNSLCDTLNVLRTFLL